MAEKRDSAKTGNGASLRSEEQFSSAADKLRGHMDAAEYKHVVLGRDYEYSLGKFAHAEGKGGSEFYSHRSVIRLLDEMVEPHKVRTCDPYCRSGGMFVSSEKSVLAQVARVGDLSIYAQERNNTRGLLCSANLASFGCTGEKSS